MMPLSPYHSAETNSAGLLESSGLLLRTGGLLAKIRWSFDEAEERGAWVSEDITEESDRFLFHAARIEPGFTLSDLFLLIQANPRLFRILGNWAEDIVAEGLTSSPVSKKSNLDAIEFLEMYWLPVLSGDEQGWDGFSRPNLHGLGYVLPKEHEGFQAGDRIPWSVMGSSAAELAALPIVLKPTMLLCDEKNRQPPIEIPAKPFLLGEILNGVIWELSFLGSPKMRDQAMQDIQAETFAATTKKQGNARSFPTPKNKHSHARKKQKQTKRR